MWKTSHIYEAVPESNIKPIISLSFCAINGVYHRNNLPKIKEGAYVTNLDKYKSIETHWKTLSVDSNNAT